MRKIISLTLSVALVFCTLGAQAAPKDADNALVTTGPRKHLGTIVLAGIAGAVLGLSTLSFYGRPQDKLSNIAVGAAVGIIGGAMFTTYKAASEPKDFYGLRSEEGAETWAMLERGRVHDQEQSPRFTYAFEF